MKESFNSHMIIVLFVNLMIENLTAHFLEEHIKMV